MGTRRLRSGSSPGKRLGGVCEPGRADPIGNPLRQTRLAVDQQMEPETDGWTRLTATVNDTWQLRWWLLGQGAGIEVIGPAELRERIRMELVEALALYYDNYYYKETMDDKY